MINRLIFKDHLYTRYMLLLLIALLLVGCSGNTITNTPTNQSTSTPVNGFGSAANHVHSLLAFPSNVLVLATHYGVYRSEDGGATWQQESDGPNQSMQGLMEFSLTASPIDPQRLYVLTLPNTAQPAATLGLYTSADGGHTWKLSIPTASLTSGSIFLAEAGNDNPDEVYVYLPNLGALGLKVSLDNGQHFSSTGKLPFGGILGLLAIPGAPGHLLAYGDDGMALSVDSGNRWQVFKNITGGIYDVTTPGPHSPIYASGDAGIFASFDGGKTFKSVDARDSFTSLTVSPVQPQVIYGETGLVVYASNNGGRTWTALPHIQGNLAVLAADPTNASEVYLSLSYPTEMYRLAPGGKQWQSLTPHI